MLHGFISCILDVPKSDSFLIQIVKACLCTTRQYFTKKRGFDENFWLENSGAKTCQNYFNRFFKINFITFLKGATNTLGPTTNSIQGKCKVPKMLQFVTSVFFGIDSSHILSSKMKALVLSQLF